MLLARVSTSIGLDPPLERCGRHARRSNAGCPDRGVTPFLPARNPRAAPASLSILAAGARETVDRVSPVFKAIGRKLFLVGEEPFRSNVIKLCGNFLLLSTIEGLAESTTFAREQGAANDLLSEILTETVFTAPFYKAYGTLMAKQTFEPAGFKLRLALNDLELLLEETARAGTGMPSAGTIRDQLKIAARQGLGDFDVASLALVRRVGIGAT